MRARAYRLLLALAASGCAQDLSVVFETRELFEGSANMLEHGCQAFSEENGIGASLFADNPNRVPRSDLVDVQRGVVGEEFQVRVQNGGVVRAARGYSRHFLESGKLDRFMLTTVGGRLYEFLLRGVPDCIDAANLPE